jgi:hypothetical protein
MFVVFLVGTIASFIGVSVREANERSRDLRSEQCRSNLRRIAEAMRQYSEQWGRFPHLSSQLDELDHEGRTTPAGNDVSPRIIRALFRDGYLDDPSAVVCPSSQDAPRHDPAAIKRNPRVFGWNGTIETSDPFHVPAKMDLDADKLTDLSYGVTIKGYTNTAPGDAMIAADRARTGIPAGPETAQRIPGNHASGWFVAHADGHVSYAPVGTPRGARLSTTGPGDGGLVVWDDANSGLEPVR